MPRVVLHKWLPSRRRWLRARKKSLRLGREFHRLQAQADSIVLNLRLATTGGELSRLTARLNDVSFYRTLAEVKAAQAARVEFYALREYQADTADIEHPLVEVPW